MPLWPLNIFSENPGRLMLLKKGVSTCLQARNNLLMMEFRHFVTKIKKGG
ncbi:hypothetical protein KDI_33690 [Dictyobacter arantiisoli]|uniref:Uncharacterized protein n=1 Tax=Dictyobacter arantiisoli TaxID=2014874 RepID=A0A5A5TF05_9CHLR|nr:hypothetical protein KDI_33690 [Dictyobacter arantiisoli]